MAGGHGYIKDDMHIEEKTGKINMSIIVTLAGGMLLVCSFLAQFLFPGQIDTETGEKVNYYASILAIGSAILLGAPLIRIAIQDLWHGHAHMNELVALAVLAAFAIGEYQEAAAISFFMIISVLIETRTAMGAKASIESLIKITPTKASKITEQGEVEADAKDLKPGDIVRVRPGDNIPADGRVLKGTSTVNQANITGESLPVDKNIEDEVFGGTINVTGVMDIEVTKAGTDTTLGRVKDLILQAERTRIPIMKMIDRYAVWYTPTILMLVGIMLFFMMSSDPNNAREAMTRAITMLVAACPCALILATPTAMVAALSAAARLGVLVKSVVDLEAARNLTAMVFDKTGTLTTGQLQVTKLTPAPGVDAADLLQATAAAEHNSRHPVARAITDVARRARLELGQPESFEEVAGKGVIAKIDGRNIIVGRGTWLAGGAVNLTAAEKDSINEVLTNPEADGQSILFVARDGQYLGWIGLEDNARPEAPAAVDQLRELGLKRLIIVTGDRESVAKRVAAQMHTEYKAEVLPHQKLEMVDSLKDAGHRVCVVGDGVNDAPALAAGDISIAMGAAGSDVAIHSATIALMNSNLNRIPFLIRLSRRASAVVKQNLLIGVGFIVLFVGLGAMGSLKPIHAAIIHIVSSMIVIFNSARLVREGEDIEHAEAAAAEKAAHVAHRHEEHHKHDHDHGAHDHDHDHGTAASPA